MNFVTITLNWMNWIFREDLSQGHRPLHNQATGCQNYHWPHTCHQGTNPHCGRPLLWRWVSMKVAHTVQLLHIVWPPPAEQHQACQHYVAGALLLARILGCVVVACFHWFSDWDAMWWHLLIGWEKAYWLLRALIADNVLVLWGILFVQEQERQSAVRFPEPSMCPWGSVWPR